MNVHSERLMIHPQPKPRARVLDRIQAKREAEAKRRAFIKAVWLRDEGRCRHCGRVVIKTLDHDPQRGEVHHRRGRNVTPEDRYNVNAAVLLCLKDHKDPAVIQKFRR